MRASYDAAGRVDTLAYPEVPGMPRFTVKHSYDGSGERQEIKDVTAAEPVPLWFVDERSDEGAKRSLQFLHQDALGSITLVTDGAGGMLSRPYYEPFGKRIASTGMAPSEPMGGGEVASVAGKNRPLQPDCGDCPPRVDARGVPMG